VSKSYTVSFKGFVFSWSVVVQAKNKTEAKIKAVLCINSTSQLPTSGGKYVIKKQ
jgi:hypothetical protein